MLVGADITAGRGSCFAALVDRDFGTMGTVSLADSDACLQQRGIGRRTVAADGELKSRSPEYKVAVFYQRSGRGGSVAVAVFDQAVAILIQHARDSRRNRVEPSEVVPAMMLLRKRKVPPNDLRRAPPLSGERLCTIVTWVRLLVP